MMKRKGVVFNLDSPEEKELYEFCIERSPTNFSGFVKKALLIYMKGCTINEPKLSGETLHQEEIQNAVDDEESLMLAMV